MKKAKIHPGDAVIYLGHQDAVCPGECPRVYLIEKLWRLRIGKVFLAGLPMPSGLQLLDEPIGEGFSSSASHCVKVHDDLLPVRLRAKAKLLRRESAKKGVS